MSGETERSAMAKGQLPGEGSVRLEPVTLPWGRLIRAHEGEGEPVAWATDAAVPDPGRIWAVLSGLHPQTGLVPILLDGLEGDTRQPWDEGEFSDPLNLSGIDRLDPGRVLGGLWARGLDTLREGEQEDPDFAQLRAPFTRGFPGLAPSGGAPLAPAERQQALDVLLPEMRLTSLPQPAARIGLVAADRPADVLAAIGWWGVANRGQEFLLPLTAVLRSWEDRFGACLIDVGFAEIRLLVERPPRTLAAAQRIAAEHGVLADRSGEGLQAVSRIAASLVNAPIWAFWWD